MHPWPRPAIGKRCVNPQGPPGRGHVISMANEQQPQPLQNRSYSTKNGRQFRAVVADRLSATARAAVYPNRTAVIHGEQRYTWARGARTMPGRSAFGARGGAAIGRGDTVAVHGRPTCPAIFEGAFRRGRMAGGGAEPR